MQDGYSLPFQVPEVVKLFAKKAYARIPDKKTSVIIGLFPSVGWFLIALGYLVVYVYGYIMFPNLEDANYYFTGFAVFGIFDFGAWVITLQLWQKCSEG